MLDRMRRGAANWMARILIALLALSFAFWGVGDYITPQQDPPIADVGDESVLLSAFRRSLDITQSQLRAEGRRLTTEEIRQSGLAREILNSLMLNEAMTISARDMGLDVSDRRIAEEIRDDPAFQGPFGGFDRDAFRIILLESGITEARFAEERRKVHLRRQLAEAILAFHSVPEILLKEMARYRNESRILEYVFLPLSLAPNPKTPDEKTLQEFAAREPALFIRPERRDIALLELGARQFFSSIAVSDEEIQAEYEAQRQNFQTPEQREVDQIVFPSREEAELASRRIKGGTSFEIIAGERGLSDEDRDLGRLTIKDFLSPSLGEAAFALKEGEVSAVVDGPLGPVLLRARRVIPGERQDFASAREQVRERLLIRKSADEIYAMRNLIEDALAGGASLEEISKQYEIPLKRFRGVSAEGETLGGASLSEEREDILASAFVLEEKSQTDALELPTGGYYWVELEKIHSSRIPPLSEIREEVLSAWMKRERFLSLSRLATDIARRGNDGESLRALLRRYRRSPLKTARVGRFFVNDALSAELVGAAFARDKGVLVAGPARIGDGVVLVRTDQIFQKDEGDAKTFQALRENLGASLANERLQQYASSLLKFYDTRIYEDVVESVLPTGSASAP